MLLRIVTALMDMLGIRENRMIPSSIPISSQLGYHMIGPCVIPALPLLTLPPLTPNPQTYWTLVKHPSPNVARGRTTNRKRRDNVCSIVTG